jgi:Tfp pilus assembly protein PilX
MLTYVKARRAFAQLPSLKAELAAASRKYDQRREFAETLAQAEALDRAEVAVAAKDAKKATAAYKQIVADYPGAEAAKRAAEQLKELSGESADPPAADNSKPAYRTWTDSSGQFKTKARLSGVEGDKVSLETENGHKIRVPIEKLSEADREFLKAQREKE